MTPTPPSTTSESAGAHSPDGPYRVVRKRNRVPLSCGPCRHRKLKCNRTNPCENCIRRGDAAGCSYAMPGTRKKNQSSSGSASSPDDMQNRIDRLEGLVLSLMTNGPQSAGPVAAQAAISGSTSDISSGSGLRNNSIQEDNDMNEDEDEDSESDSVSNSFGLLKVDAEKGKSLYLGDSHWHMVLADIAEVKAYFASHTREFESQYKIVENSNPSTALGGPASLLGMHPPASEGELRAGLPTRREIEKLVSRYFNSYDAALHIIHYPTFHKQMISHFADTTKTSIVWLGLLYSVLCQSMQSYHKIGDEPPEWKGRTLQLASEYRMRTVQCLVLSDYTKSVENTVETLLLYVHGEYTSRFDAEVGLWIIIGIIVRLAMRMGYHRDPKGFPGLTPFQGEMRRRVWTFLRHYDILFSFQLALPNMVRRGDSDTELPRNIFEDEFGRDSKELPAARPFGEPTPVSFMIANSKLVFIFGEVIEEVNTLGPIGASYDEVMRKDTKLRECKRSLPYHLQLRPLDECVHDPATLLMQRFNLDILYQKALCVLHRKYLVRARTNPRYAHSRRTCVEASMEILRHQATLHRESQLGGRMRTMRWFISSLTKHDFLLAAMIVCLDLHYDSIAEQYDRFFWTAEQRKDMHRALETSEEIWKESVEKSMEAYKASAIIRVMLEKMRTAEKGPIRSEPRTTQEAFAAFDHQDLQPEHSAAMTLGMLSSGGMTPNTANLFQGALANSGNPLTPGGTKFAGMETGMQTSGVMQTGLTPNYQMEGTSPAGNNAAVGGMSPYSQVFGNMGGLPGMMDMPSNLDWEAWDQYVQNGNSIDPSQSFFPSVYDPALTQGQGESGQNTGQGDVVNFGNSVFMGANTPGRM